jgi:dephospho-CoA kinase
MLKLKKIAITGGVASGKSSVCRFFQELGACVVSADAIVHKLLSPETSLGQKVLQLFGSEILQDGKISRRILAEKVFNSPTQLEALERLLHPAVLQKIDELYQIANRSGTCSSFVVEIPLLYEIQAEDSYDVIVAVVADEKIAKERFRQRGFQPEEYDRRMSRQLQPSQKAKRAHYILINNGSLEQLRQEVEKLNSILKENQFS